MNETIHFSDQDGTPVSATTNAEHRQLSRQIIRAVPDDDERIKLLSKTSGKTSPHHTPHTVEELRAVVEAMPGYLEELDEQRRAAAAEQAEAAVSPRQKLLARMKAAVLGGSNVTIRGEQVTADSLAKAQAAADAEAAHEKLVEAGARDMAKAAAAAEKRREKARAELRANPPKLDVEALNAATGDAKAAIGRMRAVRASYAQQLAAAGEALTEAGVETYQGYGAPEDGGSAPDRRGFLWIDGVPHNANESTAYAFAALK